MTDPSLHTQKDLLKLLHDPVTISRGELRDRELYRYLSLNEKETTPEVKLRMEKNLNLLLQASQIKQVAQIHPLTLHQGDISFGGITFHSEVLSKNLQGADYILVFVMTLGMEVDREIHTLSRLQPSDGYFIDQMATEVLEGACNKWIRHIGRKIKDYGYTQKPRFSPGFADFGLENQALLLNFLQAKKQIHVATTKANMMVPTKSISAVAGFRKSIATQSKEES